MAKLAILQPKYRSFVMISMLTTFDETSHRCPTLPKIEPEGGNQNVNCNKFGQKSTKKI